MTNPAPPGGEERPNVDPLGVDLGVDEVPPPAYETTELLEPTPAYDALAAEAPLSEPAGAAPAGALTPEADYALAPNATDAGPLAPVKAFAAEKPAAFLGAALAVGWLLGKITSRGKRRSARRGDPEAG